MVCLLIAGTIVFGFVVMGLWNALIPELFKGPVLSFWQAVGLLLLSHILLRGWGSGGWGHNRWRHRFEEKLAAMTPEERDKFKEEWRRRCGWDHGPDPKENKAG
jgi:hypothetical protein